MLVPYPLRCDYLLLLFVIYDRKQRFMSFGVLVGQKMRNEDDS